MSRTRHTTDPLIRRLQPFIDGELDSTEAAKVAAEIAADPALKDMVDEQVTARQALQDLPKENASQSLRARILLELDAVDREAEYDDEVAQQRTWSRLRGFLRGGLVIAPAAAAAVLLFAVTRVSTPEAAPIQLAATPDAEDMSLSALTPQIVGAAPGDAAAGINLVSLGDLDDTSVPGPELFEYPLGERGGRAVELRQPSRGGALRGTPYTFHGQTYVLSRDRVGRPLVAYDDGVLLHVLVPSIPSGDGDLRDLLELGDRLRRAPTR